MSDLPTRPSRSTLAPGSLNALDPGSASIFEHAIAQASTAVLITDANWDDGGPFIVYVNPAFCQMTGYQPGQLIGKSPRILQGPRTSRALMEALRETLRKGLPFTGSTVNYTADRRAYIVEWTISPVRDPDGVVRHFVSAQTDITARIAAEQERRLLLQALGAALDPILITDRSTRVVFVNEAFQRLSGYASDEIIGQSARALYPAHQGPDFYRNLRASLRSGRPFRATFTYRRKDGSSFYIEQSIAPVYDANRKITHYISTGKDVSERVERERRLIDMATRDPLTGLSNRRAGNLALDSLVSDAHAAAKPLSLILADIDRFKAINDTYGHQAGDEVLMEVGRILRSGIRDSDVAVRWGGEEFLVMAPGCALQEALDLSERLRRAVGALDFKSVGRVTLSLGVAELRPGESTGSLLQRADTAMYKAKHDGRDRVVASPAE